MFKIDAYVKVQNVPHDGSVLVQEIQISKEGLAMIMIEEQILAIQKRMSKRRRELSQLEEAQREDQKAMNKFIQAVEELRKSRPY